MEDFTDCFSDFEDPRYDNARHDLHDILLITLCTIMCGGQDCTDRPLFGRANESFLRQLLKLDHGIPSHDTFDRVLRLLDPAPFHSCFLTFMRRFFQRLQGVVALDGKTLRRSFDRAAGKSPLHRISAWSVEQRPVLGQIAVDDKPNEITAIFKLLELLAFKGSVVTADALNCQRIIAAKIVRKGGDCVLALKGNQGSLHADVSLFLDDPATRPTSTPSSVDAGHGRIETCTATVATDIAWLQKAGAWPGLAACGKMTRRREQNGGAWNETAYLPPAQSALRRRASATSSAPIGTSRTLCIGFSTSP